MCVCGFHWACECGSGGWQGRVRFIETVGVTSKKKRSYPLQNNSWHYFPYLLGLPAVVCYLFFFTFSALDICSNYHNYVLNVYSCGLFIIDWHYNDIKRGAAIGKWFRKEKVM